MKQEFSVHAEHDQAAQVVELVIRCSPNLVRMALDVALLQIEEVTPDQAPAERVALPAALNTAAPPVPTWEHRGSSPVLPKWQF